MKKIPFFILFLIAEIFLSGCTDIFPKGKTAYVFMVRDIDHFAGADVLVRSGDRSMIDRITDNAFYEKIFPILRNKMGSYLKYNYVFNNGWITSRDMEQKIARFKEGDNPILFVYMNNRFDYVNIYNAGLEVHLSQIEVDISLLWDSKKPRYIFKDVVSSEDVLPKLDSSFDRRFIEIVNLDPSTVFSREDTPDDMKRIIGRELETMWAVLYQQSDQRLIQKKKVQVIRSWFAANP